jgi:hypothetical protein
MCGILTRKDSKSLDNGYQVQSQKTEIFRISERQTTNQKMMDSWENTKIALPHHF